MNNLQLYTCCFTGHRDIPPGEYPKIKARLKSRIEDLIYNHDVLYFGVGGALGFDTLVAQYMLELRAHNPRIKVIEVLPFREYRRLWTPYQQSVAASIDRQCDKIVYCCDTPSREAFLARNRHLVDCAEYCISYCTRPTGGTAYTVRYALDNSRVVHNMSSWDVSQIFY